MNKDIENNNIFHNKISNFDIKRMTPIINHNKPVINFVGYNAQGERITDINYYKTTPGRNLEKAMEFKTTSNYFAPCNENKINNKYEIYEYIPIQKPTILNKENLKKLK